jgi:hypothetical protein
VFVKVVLDGPFNPRSQAIEEILIPFSAGTVIAADHAVPEEEFQGAFGLPGFRGSRAGLQLRLQSSGQGVQVLCKGVDS